MSFRVRQTWDIGLSSAGSLLSLDKTGSVIIWFDLYSWSQTFLFLFCRRLKCDDFLSPQNTHHLELPPPPLGKFVWLFFLYSLINVHTGCYHHRPSKQHFFLSSLLLSLLTFLACLLSTFFCFLASSLPFLFSFVLPLFPSLLHIELEAPL